MKKLCDYTGRDFLELLASDAPAPGGGGGAAMAGALAAALSSMVGNLTAGKKKFAEHEEEVRLLLKKAETLRTAMLDLADRDAEVFTRFMECYKLPKSNEREKEIRSAAIREAAKLAAGVPLEIARNSMSILETAERLAVIGNPSVITDAAVSALLARAALRSAEYNVRINLSLTNDREFNETAENELAELQQKALAAEQKILQLTDKAIG